MHGVMFAELAKLLWQLELWRSLLLSALMFKTLMTGFFSVEGNYCGAFRFYSANALAVYTK